MPKEGRLVDVVKQVRSIALTKKNAATMHISKIQGKNGVNKLVHTTPGSTTRHRTLRLASPANSLSNSETTRSPMYLLAS